MIEYSDIEIEGKSITSITITNVQDLLNKMREVSIHIYEEIDPVAINDGHIRNKVEITKDVHMGLIGHIAVAELLRRKDKDCKVILEDNSFHLVCNKKTIKVKNSLAKTDPCPAKHMKAFSIIGHKTKGEKIFDYYAQIVFCSAPIIENDKDFKIHMFFVGFVHNSQLTETKEYSKHDYKAAKISNSKDLKRLLEDLVD
ncbi:MULTISPECIES: hypothetical protein [Aliarcobacter]|uniref:hypothetical protein n=1 Tax=Aliarcobacter TaxID=2321111 RepID=UPI000828A1DA|nr:MULTISPECIES: hypothetical protein [Aliarcobacter]MDD2509290.1 hypothetical protein [Aliarcobacter skirrowii]MDD3497400.1 hypothetical protein [Aliarcobacter skirrowii]MDX4028293.1 hypothetical protein [Aliarcobacter skirrowii]OCL93685.1 hypothetical protein AAX25_00004 [Aliarcobacter thereius]